MDMYPYEAFSLTHTYRFYIPIDTALYIHIHIYRGNVSMHISTFLLHNISTYVHIFYTYIHMSIHMSIHTFFLIYKPYTYLKWLSHTYPHISLPIYICIFTYIYTCIKYQCSTDLYLCICLRIYA